MRRIYKFVALSSVMAIILSMLFMFSASAANIKYSVTGASGAKGDTVTVSVNLSSDIQIWGANVSLGFNPNELQYVSCAKGGLVSGGSLNASGSSINFSGMYGAKSGTVFTVKFKILKDSGTSSLTLSSTENTDENGEVYSCSTSGGSVTVVKSVTGISLNNSSVTLKKGETSQLTATVTPSDATDKTVKFTSSNTKVATVNSSGKITAVGGGTAKITATAGGKSAECTVNVKVAQTGIGISGSKDKKVEEGATLKLTVAKVPADATDSYSVSWTSSDNSIATVSANGTVTGVKIGTVVITATSNGWKAVYNITVTEKTTDAESESTSEEPSSEEPTNEEPSSEMSTEPTTEEITTTADKENAEFVKKGYHYAMLVMVAVITALVTVPATALVTSNIYKHRIKKNDKDSFNPWENER